MSKLKRFGDYCIDMGYCSVSDVERAAHIQQDLVTRGHPRMLIGLVMVRYGILSNAQLIEVLKALEQQHVAAILAN